MHQLQRNIPFFMSVMDISSRYIMNHYMYTTMTNGDIQLTIQRAKGKFPNTSRHLIADNGAQYTALKFTRFLQQLRIQYTIISPAYLQSLGRIEHFHRSLSEKCLELTGMLRFEYVRQQIVRYIDYYNNHRLHTLVHYLHPVDFFEGNQKRWIKERQPRLDKITHERRHFGKKTQRNDKAA